MMKQCPRCATDISRVIHTSTPMNKVSLVRSATRSEVEIIGAEASDIFYCLCSYSLTGGIEIKYTDTTIWKVYIAKDGILTGDSGTGDTLQEAIGNAQDKIDILQAGVGQ